MDARTAAAMLDGAHSDIRRALAEWDAADLDRVENCSRLLEQAVSGMRAFEQALRSGEALPSPDLYRKLQETRQDIVRATRVVDACVAFHRGLAVRSGGAAAGYNSEGRLAGESAGMAPEVLA